MAELIKKTDTLNEGRVKLNKAITDANKAKEDASTAKTTAQQAKALSESTQTQLDTIVIEGDSSVEAAQARVDAGGTAYSTLKERLDTEHGELSTQLAETNSKLRVKDWELQSKGRRTLPGGMGSVISDDGFVEDLTILKPILDTYNIPLCSAVPSALVGETGRMTIEQLKELEKNGHEILAHSKNHPYNPLIVDMTDAQSEAEFRDSIQELNDMGLNVQSMSYVGGNYKKRERLYAEKYYRSARCSDHGTANGINYPPLNTFELKTWWVDPSAYRLAELLRNHPRKEAISIMLNETKAIIDRARDTNGYLIISTHADQLKDADIQELVKQVMQYFSSNLKMVTVRDALNQMGNMVEVGDFSQQGNRAPNDTHFVVGADGTVSGSTTITKPNRFTPESTLKEFPHGVTITPVKFSHATNAPNSQSGTMITCRFDDTDKGYNIQYYNVYNTNRVYYRHIEGGGNTFKSSWTPVDKIQLPNEGNYTPASPLSAFPVGISVSVVYSSNPDISKAPNGKNGTLITYKVFPGDTSVGYSFQEYHVFGTGETFKRAASSESKWGDWTIQKGITLPGEHGFNLATPFSDFPLGISYSIITSTNSSVTIAPDGQRGTLVTHKLTTDTTIGYNYQEYTVAPTGATYKRFATNLTTWGTWTKVSEV